MFALQTADTNRMVYIRAKNQSKVLKKKCPHPFQMALGPVLILSHVK